MGSVGNPLRPGFAPGKAISNNVYDSLNRAGVRDVSMQTPLGGLNSGKNLLYTNAVTAPVAYGVGVATHDHRALNAFKDPGYELSQLGNPVAYTSDPRSTQEEKTRKEGARAADVLAYRARQGALAAGTGGGGMQVNAENDAYNQTQLRYEQIIQQRNMQQQQMAIQNLGILFKLFGFGA